MLTADLIGVRRRGDELVLAGSDGARVQALAGSLTNLARGHLGRPRDELEEAFDRQAGALATPAERRLAAAVAKLVLDGCRFDGPPAEEAIALRRALFRRAAAARRAASAEAPFDREALVAAAAEERGILPAALEAALFGDRPGAQRLAAVEVAPPAVLAAGFPLAEAQAVLLRATKVRATVRARDAGTLRQLFRALKFQRLLPLITPGPDGAVQIELDGPLSLFQGGTRYGLQLGLALPPIAACDAGAIAAAVRWGAERRPLRFRLRGAQQPVAGSGAPPHVSDEIADLMTAFGRLESGWRIQADPAVLDLPGVGLCVPDLTFVRAADGARVHFELLGFWSREAVWRRVELVEAGLPQRILFAASRNLRVGEQVLDGSGTAALYVFTRVLDARQILKRVERLAASNPSGSAG